MNTMHSARLLSRSALIAAAAVACLALTVQAAPIPGAATVQDLINLNQGDPNDGVPQGGVVVDGLQFYDFQYAETGTNGGVAPTASQVGVQTAPGPAGSSGLEFSFDWTAAAGTGMLSTIRYKVHSTNPLQPVDRVGAFFDGDVPGPSSTATFAQVTETVRDLQGNVLGMIGLFNDGNAAGTDRQAGSLDLAPPRQDLDLSKAIRVRSDTAGVATISIVDNTFRVVPEPASLGLIALGGVLTLRRARKN